MKNSEIAWTTHTFNPWIGCTKVSDGCKNCYAEALDRRWGKKRWGPKAARVRTSAANWKQPVKWNAEAKEAGRRDRVFCASLADVFDDHDSIDPHWRADLFSLIDATPYLDWLLLTKRPENIARLNPEYFSARQAEEPAPFRPNVWLGTTVENQEQANLRIPALLQVPAAVRFLSCEPLLEPVNLGLIGTVPKDWGYGYIPVAALLHWVIVGGESGAGARPFDIRWARELVKECREAEVACFVKQLGAVPTVGYYDDATRQWFEANGWEWPDPIGWDERDGQPSMTARVNVRGKDRKGGDLSEWPADLRIRQFPESRNG